jgi:multidrug efflux pump
MQPVQDLTIDDRVSRTQYQFSPRERGSGRPGDLDSQARQTACASCPQINDVASDQSEGGLQAYLEIDRDTAARLGVTVATIDNALYNAFGQRLISTIFTQSNQYRVVLEAPTRPAAQPDGARQHLRDLGHRRAGAAHGGGEVETSATPRCRSTHAAQFPATISFNLAARLLARRCRDRHRQARRDLGCRRASSRASRGRRRRSAPPSPTPLPDLAAVVTMYIVLGVLYESYIHPITILSTLPSAGVGALLALSSPAPTSA